VLTTLFIIFSALALIIAALILIPLRVRFYSLVETGALVLVVDLVLLYSGLKLRFARRGHRNTIEVLVVNRTVYERELKESKRRPLSLSQFFRSAQVFPEITEPILGLISGLVKATRIKDIRVRCKVGFNDPSLLGTFYGAYSGFAGLISPWAPKDVVYLEPDFKGDAFEGQFHVEMEIAQYMLLVPMARLALKLLKRSKSFRSGKNR